MNGKAQRILEFNKILELLASETTSSSGAGRCLALEPSVSISEIETWQEETSCAVSRLLRRGRPSFAHDEGIALSLRRLEIGSPLMAKDLLQIAALLENSGRARSYGARERSDDTSDILEFMFTSLDPLPHLSKEIRRCILSESEIADDASPELRRIRRAKASCSDRIHSQLTSILNGPARTALQDYVITMRNGRYCVPVKAEARSSVPGMIHDQSSTGATVFIEPMAVVQLNNEIRELELKEAAEIDAILARLSGAAAEDAGKIGLDLHVMSDLDVIFARGRLALSMNATRPRYNSDGRIRLRGARHPLIDKRRVVPIDVRLGDDFDLLIVTGPNTGGKTVSLKTTGLLTLMGQAGLHIPCLDRSELSVFTEVYADIGDEQSIEQSLSTFSSHMTNIVSFLEKADEGSLVLFDELGAGTDPTEGAALAISILSYLHGRGIRTMATTHYSELKVYALRTEGVENASCEFDIQTLRPTYRLLIGVPGKSNAFAISSKLGLPAHIIDDARDQIGIKETAFEDVISRLENDRISLERDRDALRKEQNEWESKRKQLEAREKDLDSRRSAIIDEAKEEARGILLDAKDYADKAMREFRKAGRSGASVSELDKKRSALRERALRTAPGTKELRRDKRGPSLRPDDLHPGDSVRVLSMNLNGIVRSLPDQKGMVTVQMGILSSKVSIDDLEMADEPDIITPKGVPAKSGGIKMSKSLSVSPEIKVIGKTVDDAISELDKYLDDAYIAHLDSVRIVHGKGTGALRKGIHAYLKTQRHVASFELAAFGEGDAGVTVVKFKK